MQPVGERTARCQHTLDVSRQCQARSLESLLLLEQECLDRRAQLLLLLRHGRLAPRCSDRRIVGTCASWFRVRQRLIREVGSEIELRRGGGGGIRVSDDAPALRQSCRGRTDDAAERSQLLESTRCTGRSLILLW